MKAPENHGTSCRYLPKKGTAHETMDWVVPRTFQIVFYVTVISAYSTGSINKTACRRRCILADINPKVGYALAGVNDGITIV